MSKSKSGKAAVSKNSRTDRKAVEYRYKGDLVAPILFDGTFTGKGAFMAAVKVGTQELVMKDGTTNPLNWQEIITAG